MFNRIFSRLFLGDDNVIRDTSTVVIGDINDGNEHLVVVRRKGDLLELFFDGVLVGGSQLNSDILEVDSDIRIGRSHFDSFDFNGTIRDFKIFNYALSDEEIDVL